jgi:hypothetical protein
MAEMTVEELRQIQAELDQQHVAEMRYELDRKLRQYIVDWAQAISDKLAMAAMSAVTGRWDDVMKDVSRGRITQTQVFALLDEFMKCRLMSATAYDWRKQQILFDGNRSRNDC